MNIINVLNDKRIRGRLLKDPATWQNWFALLKCFFPLKLSQKDLSLYRESTGRQKGQSANITGYGLT